MKGTGFVDFDSVSALPDSALDCLADSEGIDDISEPSAEEEPDRLRKGVILWI